MQYLGRVSPLIACLFLVACPAEKKDAAASGGSAQPAAPAAPASQPSGGSASAEPAQGGAAFSGELRLADGLAEDTVKATDVLFLVARQSVGGQPGQIIATQRHTPVKLPMKFTLGAQDAMVPGTPFTGPFVVTARLDRDGDPMTKGEEDLYASASGEVKPGDASVALVLSRGMPASANPAGAAPSAAPGTESAGSQPAK